MASQTYKAWSVVTASTTAFTVCFMVWMMFAVIGIPIKQNLGLNETQFGVLVALPVLTGSLIRLPLGMWTDRFGGRIVFFILMLSTVFPIWLISRATEFWHFLVTGLFVGVAGGSFTVGIAYCARWFPRERQGLAMGIFGVGNTGAAVTKLVAPTIVVAYGWAMVPQVYAVLMLVTAIAVLVLQLHGRRARRRRRAGHDAGSSWRCSRTRPCGATASTTRSSSAATSRCRCG